VVRYEESLVVEDATDSGGRATEGSELVDYCVKMRRLPDATRADLLLERGALKMSDLDEIARVLAQFHEKCASSDAIARFGEQDSVAFNVRENLEQARPFLGRLLGDERAKALGQRQLEFLKENEQLLAARATSGKVRDGHGDLRLEHIYLTDGGLQIIDCIEFNERFRYADVCADLAFLTMDLRHRGRADMAERLLSKYAILSGDYGLYELVDFYESYRAYVRGKVTAFLAQQKSEADGELERRATVYFEQAFAGLSPAATAPRLICVGGLIASGKSTVAERLRCRLALPLVDTDRTRKRMAGLGPTDRGSDDAFRGIYSAEFSRKVYEEVLSAARGVLQSGRSVLVEASFTKREQRTCARDLAQTLGVGLSFVECRVPDRVARERLVKREGQVSVSDGRLDVYDAVAADAEPITLGELESHLVLDTTLSETSQARKLQELDLW
jgi:aminoglycoside phosphotransferase family enzyme/predicted kinase